MSAKNLIEDCAELLQQATRLVASIGDDVFAARTPISPRGSIGAHLRHVLDFYTCFFKGLDELRVEYNERPRDPDSESKRHHALARIELTIDQLRRLTTVDSNAHLLVRLECGTSYSRSSFLRELDFLKSHTIHHYSLIAMLLRLHEIDPGPEFGVAPSTLKHWSEELVCAR